MQSAFLRFVAATAVSLALATPASADFILTNNSGSATARTDYGGTQGPQPQNIVNTFGPVGGAALSDYELRNFGRIRGVQTGFGLNAVSVDTRFSDFISFDWSAKTTYDVEVAQTGASRSSLDFQYHLNGGQLALYDPTNRFDGLVASVGVSIFAISPGFSGFLWSWHLTLRGSQGVVTPTVDFLIDPLGFGVPVLSAVTIDNGEAVVDIGSFTASANLGILTGSNTAFVTYDMDAAVAGLGILGQGGKAVLGDPFNASGNYGAGIAFRDVAVGALPEPSALVLLASALLLIPVSRRGATRA